MSHAVLTPPAELQQTSELQQGWDGHSQFLANNVQHVGQLFGVMGMPWRENLGYIKNMTQPWARGDHARPENQVSLSDTQKEQTRALYEDMKLIQRIELPRGEYNGLILLGGLQSSNNRCLEFLRQTLDSENVTLTENAKIALWGGVRTIDTDKEAPFIQSSLSGAAADAARDTWLNGLAEPSDVLTESDGLRLGVHDKLGSLALKRLHLRTGLVDENETVQKPLVTHWDFDRMGHEVVLLNTGAVNRPLGAPRHTTEACARQWAELYGNTLPQNARIGFIVSQPYGLRTTRVVQKVLDETGLDGIQLVGAGPAAPQTLGDHIFRGEIARNIYEDFKSVT